MSIMSSCPRPSFGPSNSSPSSLLLRPSLAVRSLPDPDSTAICRRQPSNIAVVFDVPLRFNRRNGRAMLDHHRKTYNKFENRRIKCWLFECSTNYGGERELINLVISVRGMKLLNSAKDESFLHLSKIE